MNQNQEKRKNVYVDDLGIIKSLKKHHAKDYELYDFAIQKRLKRQKYA